MSELPLVLTVEETAKALRISRGAVYEAVRCGDIPSVRIGRTIRVPRHRIVELLGEHNHDAAASRNGGESAETPPRP